MDGQVQNALMRYRSNCWEMESVTRLPRTLERIISQRSIELYITSGTASDWYYDVSIEVNDDVKKQNNIYTRLDSGELIQLNCETLGNMDLFFHLLKLFLLEKKYGQASDTLFRLSLIPTQENKGTTTSIFSTCLIIQLRLKVSHCAVLLLQFSGL